MSASKHPSTCATCGVAGPPRGPIAIQAGWSRPRAGWLCPIHIMLGIADSKAHGRGDGSAREYSPAVQGMVDRELRSRGYHRVMYNAEDMERMLDEAGQPSNAEMLERLRPAIEARARAQAEADASGESVTVFLHLMDGGAHLGTERVIVRPLADFKVPP